MAFEIPDDYVDVAGRIREFREKWPDGSLQQVKVDMINFGGKDWVVYTAAAYRSQDDQRPGMGTAWEPVPGRTPYTRDSELQNAETAAWGRAIVAVLAADTKKVASADEVRNRQEDRRPVPEPSPRSQALARLHRLSKGLGIEAPDFGAWLKVKVDGAGLDGSKTDDLVRLADQLEAAQ